MKEIAMAGTRKRTPKGKGDISPKRLKQLNSFAGRISRILDLPLLLTEVYRELLVLFASRDAALILNDEADAYGLDGVMHARRSEGFTGIRLDIHRTGTGSAIAQAEGPVVIADLLRLDGIPENARKRLSGTVPECVLGAPVFSEGQRTGIIAVGRGRECDFSTEDKALMYLVAEHVSNAIQNAIRFRYEKLCSLEWVRAVDALKEGILVHDRSNRILRANRRFSEIVGKNLSEIVGRLCSEVMPGSNGEGCPYCERGDHCDDAGKVTGVSTCPIQDDQENTCSVVHVVQSGDRISETPFDGSLDALGGLISGIAHEVKSPLTGIIGYSELALEQIRDKKLADDKVLEYLNRIHSEGNRAYRIVHDLLYFSRRNPPETGRIRINEILAALLDGEARRFKKHHIHLTKNLKEIPDLWGDPRQIQQVLANILSNAVQALTITEGDRDLKVSTSAEGKGVKVSIHDTGPGVPQEVRAKIFDPFFGTADFSDGIGLGLSVAYGIVNAHGGEISLANCAKGTEVMISLPTRKEG